jgi:hypothetical protein
MPSRDRGYTQTYRESRLTTKELLEAVFLFWYDPKLYRKDNSGS